jgi:hypothetical protein
MSTLQASDRLEIITDDAPALAGPASPDASPAAPVEAPTRSSGSTGRPSFTITDAAIACAVSRKTITRKLGDLASHGAAKDEDGIWRIPVEALLAVGLHPGRSLPEAPRPVQRPMGPGPVQAPAVAPAQTGPDMVTVPRDRWDDLRIRLARAEAEATERALALADARLALRALTAGPQGRTEQRDPAVGSARSGPIPLEHRTPAAEPPADPPTAQAADPSGPATAGRSTPASAAAPMAADPAAELAAARSQAARTGGYVPPAGGAPVRKRRWWQSK